MKAYPTGIPDVLVLEPRVHHDERGFFFESFNQRVFRNIVGQDVAFVQENHSQSKRGVLRGLHYQLQRPQGKLVRVPRGEVFDVAVDLRRSSPSFGRWVGVLLSEENQRQLWIPAGFAHGFLALSSTVDLLYKVTDFYAPELERCIAWNDPTLAIEWPLDSAPLVSGRDSFGSPFSASDVFP